MKGLTDSSTLLICLAPILNTSFQLSVKEINIGLLMDGVTSLLRLNTSIMIYSDPVIKQFSSVLPFKENRKFLLTIEVSSL